MPVSDAEARPQRHNSDRRVAKLETAIQELLEQVLAAEDPVDPTVEEMLEALTRVSSSLTRALRHGQSTPSTTIKLGADQGTKVAR